MWNPTPSSASSSSSQSSDNKPHARELEVDDGKCSGEQQQLSLVQQLQQHSAKSNSKHQTSTFGGQLTSSSTTSNQENKQQQQADILPSIIAGDQEDDDSEAKKHLESCEEAADSGFLSGPQTSSSNIFPDTDKSGSSSIRRLSKQNLNIIANVDNQQQQEKTQLNEALNFDSGYIQEADNDFSETNLQPESTTSANDQMLLKNNVDAGMSEWFCNLSLQNNAGGGDSATSAQRVPNSANASAAGFAINNLDAPLSSRPAQQTPSPRPTPSPSTTSLPTSINQHAAGSSATNIATQQTQTANVPQHITAANAWEYYYQQNDDGDTPLHLACISGYVDVVAALIRMAPHPCLFNIQNDEAQTPLHLATLTARPKIIRMLLIAGAEPTVRDRHGNTALHLACISGEGQCVQALTIPISQSEIQDAHRRQYGHRANDKSYVKCAVLPSDLEIRNYDGERCVHLAAQAGYIDILRILVLYGADINAREGKSGRTPLHIAIECCNEDLANFLLDDCQKLNLETATYAGLTAYQVACILNKSEMQDILEKRGAEPLTPPDSDYDSSDIETDIEDAKFYDRFGDPGYFVGYKGGNCMTVA